MSSSMLPLMSSSSAEVQLGARRAPVGPLRRADEELERLLLAVLVDLEVVRPCRSVT